MPLPISDQQQPRP